MSYRNFVKQSKKLAYVLMLPIALWLTSCKTTKSIQQQNINATTVAQKATTEQVQTIDTTRKLDSIFTKITDTYYSKPDAGGRQYITHIATTQKRQISIRKNAIAQAVFKTENSTVKSTAKIQTKQTVKQQTKTSSFFVILAWIIGVGIVIAVLLILKRFGIIKLNI